MSEDKIALLSKRQELFGYEVLDYLLNNEDKPVYIIRNKTILSELRNKGKEGKIEVVSYVVLDEKGEATILNIDYGKIKTADDYWKNSVNYYTIYGMSDLMDEWDK